MKKTDSASVLRLSKAFVAWFVLLAWSATAVAVTWPASAPSGETVWGKFTALFQKVLVDANPATSDGTVKRAISLSQSCPSGQAIQGFSSTGAIICSAAGWSSGGSPAPSAPVTTTVPAPPSDTGTLGTITSAIENFNGWWLPFEMVPRCDLDPAVYRSAKWLCMAKRLGGKTFVRNVIIDGWGERYAYTFYVKFSADWMYAYAGSNRTPARPGESDFQRILYVQTPPIYSPVLAANIRTAVNTTGIKWLVPSSLSIKLIHSSFALGDMNPYWGLNRIEYSDPYRTLIWPAMSNDYVPTNWWPSWIEMPTDGTKIMGTTRNPKYCYNPSIASSYDESKEIVGKQIRSTNEMALSGDPFNDTLKVALQPNVTSPVSQVNVSSQNTFVTTDHYVCSDVLSGTSTLPVAIPPVPVN